MDEVSAAQAAMLTGLSERTIRRKIASGKLAARRVAPNRFAIAVRDLPRRRDVNELVRRLEALEHRVALLEERQHVPQMPQMPRLSRDVAAGGADAATLASGLADGTSGEDLAQVLIQLAHEVERFAPLLAPPAHGERDQEPDATAPLSGAWSADMPDVSDDAAG